MQNTRKIFQKKNYSNTNRLRKKEEFPTAQRKKL